MKKFLKTLLVLIILGGAGYFGYQYYQSTQVEPTASAATTGYTQAVVSKGDLSKTVTGTGTLSIGETKNVAADYAIVVSGSIVEVGDVVAEGDALLRIDTDALQTTISTLQEELDTCESDIATASSDYSSTANIRMPITGRVKELYISEGQQIEDVMKEKGAIALLSLDGKMYVEVEAAEGMKITSTVKVKHAKGTADGTVREIADGKAKITFTDEVVLEGEQVEVILGKTSLGTFTAHINVPYTLTTTQKGFISKNYLAINGKRWSGNYALYLINIPVSDEFKALEVTREKLMAKLQTAKAMLSAQAVISPIDGVVSSVTEASTAEVVAGTTLATLYIGDKKQMLVSVDELDIINVEVGQSVDIVMDALPDKTYSATVSHVSHIGTAESGVTVYSVTLSIDGDEQLKIGMNGTATIKVQEISDTLLVPIAALNTSRDGQYVWVYDESQAADSDEPGVKTFITTGMSDENYAQVLSGLSEGDIVLITREASGSSGNNFNMGGGMMMDFGGSMPSGGAMPSGGTPGGNGNRNGGGTR